MADEDLAYLDPSFDPNSVTMPKLRQILLTHNVQYPSSAKKHDLVELFNQNVAPQAKRILAARARTKRSTRGIEDMSSQGGTAAEPDEGDSMPPPSAAKRSSRRTTRAQTAESEETPTTRPKPERSPVKRGSRKTLRPPEEEGEEPPERPAARRGRHSSRATSHVKEEDSEPETWHVQGEMSNFSSDNPFQSGSSPPAPEKPRRRMTLGIEQEDRREKNSDRRKTDNYEVNRGDSGHKPSRKSMDVPVSLLKKRATPAPPNVVEPGEEFTPEEQLELEQEQAENGGAAVLPPRRPKRSVPSSNTAKIAPLAISLAMFAGFAAVWRQEKLEVGYCGVGPAPSGMQIPEWANFVKPSCEPCPPHASCYENLRTECDKDFVLKSHPLSLSGLIPLPPTCEPDTEKEWIVSQFAKRAVNELRDRNAKYECGDLTDEEGVPLPSPGLGEDELKEEVASKRKKGMSQAEFDELWAPALGEILRQEDVTSNVDGNGRRVLSSNSLSRIPLLCSIRRSVRLTLARYIWKLVALFLVLALGFYAKLSFARKKQTEKRSKQLASAVLNMLAEQAAYNAYDPKAYPEPWISVSQLRDDILRDEFSPSKRIRVWKRVSELVEHNSNVRPAVREGRSGDISRVWEWIGAIRVVDDGRGDGRRSSSRFSLGASYADSPGALSPSLVDGGHPEMKQFKKWDEGGSVLA